MNHLNAFTEVTMPDGAKWRRMKTDKVEILLTGAARNFFRQNKWLFTEVIPGNLQPVTKHVLKTTRKITKLLRAWKDKNQIDELEFIASGQNADFFRIQWTKMWLRELKANGEVPDPTLEKLKRMDKIQEIMESGEIPRWIHVPVHFWAFIMPPDSTSNKWREFLLMEVVDHGVTGEDLKRAAKKESERFPGAQKAVIEEFGDENLEELLQEMEKQIDEAMTILQAACMKRGENFRQLFMDYNRKNIVIQYLKPPVGWKKMWFWIIDQ